MMLKPADLPRLGRDDVEELRLALVMNGGVSLAVWIGGVASEFNRLVRGKEGVYADLLRATGTDVRVDVISGTSAGGINGALLALASVYDADLDPLREVWLEQGALEELLRSPVESDPPSLLRGNDYFLKELQKAFARIRASGVRLADPSDVPIVLTLTATLLRGNPNSISDDFGTVIADVDHRAQFVFVRGPDLEHDAFDDARIAERLAFAARATASFPVAFEPVFYPAGAPDDVGAPRTSEARNLAANRYLLDGGILDNKPLESAVDAIFAQRASGDVRRILAYVVPNPGATAAPAPDEANQMPGIGQVTMASLMELPRVESISAQIEAVVRQNQQVRRKHQNRAGVMTLGSSTLEELGRQLFPVYRRRRLESSADYLLPQVSAGLVSRTRGKVALGRRLREWLMTRFLESADQVPWAPRFDPLDEKAAAERTNWRWGVFALENMADTMLDVLRRTLALTSPGDGDAVARATIRGLRTDAYDLLREVSRRRANDSAFWRGQGEALVDFLADEGTGGLRGPTVRAWISNALAAWEGQFATHGASLADLAHNMAAIIIRAAEQFRLQFASADDWVRAEDRAAHDALRQHYDALAPRGCAVEDTLRNLLVVEVVVNAFGSYRDVRDQYVEMVQVSADVPTSFGGPDSAVDKLAGAQLANFGAFLKRSWRANDWMFGRLDGAERLSRILLNPERLRRLYGIYGARNRQSGAEVALEVIHWLAVQHVSGRADRAFLERLWRNDTTRMQAELAYLDDANVPVPEQLPVCAAAVTRRIHLEILRAELPVIAGAVEFDLERGGNPRGYGQDFALSWDQSTRESPGRPMSPETIVALFRREKVGRERLAQEVGSDLMTSIASRALAVTVAAGASRKANLGPVRRIFQAGRVPAIAFDFFAQGLITRSRTMVALFTAALTVGATLLLLGLAFVAEMPGVLRTAGAMLLAATMAVAFLRYHVLASIVLAAGGILLVAAIGPGWFSTAGLDADDIGWIRLSAVFAYLTLVCAVAYVVSRGPRERFVRKNHRQKKKAPSS